MNQSYVAATQRLEEMQEMCRLAIGFVITASVLERYWKAATGEPGMN